MNNNWDIFYWLQKNELYDYSIGHSQKDYSVLTLSSFETFMLFFKINS